MVSLWATRIGVWSVEDVEEGIAQVAANKNVDAPSHVICWIGAHFPVLVADGGSDFLGKGRADTGPSRLMVEELCHREKGIADRFAFEAAA